MIAEEQATRTLELSQGYVVVVDAEDHQWLSAFKWCAQVVRGGRLVYAMRSDYTNGKQRTVLMHREILWAMPGEQADHVNGDTLDNRRSNLRIATVSENQHNMGSHREVGTSILKGVSWDSRRGKWLARISLDGKKRHLGYFEREGHAAHAYDAAARELFGEYACLNFPEPGERGVFDDEPEEVAA